MGAVGLLVAGLATLGMAATASASGTVTAAPDTGLTNGSSVTLTGSGFAASSTGNILECNNATGEPTVALGSPVNNSVPVGCTAPGYSANGLTSTSATGTVSKVYTVATGVLGPPCGSSTAIISTCPSTDSAGRSPAADAADYPCPPTAAQQAAGVQCALIFGDSNGDSATAPIQFQGELTPTTTTTPPTTVAPVTTTIPTTTAPAAPAPAPLATTGAGPGLWLLLVAGLVLLSLGALLWVTSSGARRAAAISARPGRGP